MNKKLYVGGLSYKTTEEALHNLFAQVGDVDNVRIITDRETGRSKGFGFVEMISADSVNTAIEELNGKEFDGRTITVTEARPQERREPRPNNNRGSRW